MTNKEGHQQLWQWLADNPDKEKRDYPKWDFNGGKVEDAMNFCFACEEAKANCLNCPIDWFGNDCTNTFSEYIAWRIAKGKERSRLALVIKELWK